MSRQRIGYAVPKEAFGVRHPTLAYLGELFLVDILGELALGLVVLVLGTWAFAAFAAGWDQHREVTLAAAGLFVSFLVYGAWSIFAEAFGRELRWPRVAAAGAVTVVILTSYSIYFI